jgi:hypothetical protein
MRSFQRIALLGYKRLSVVGVPNDMLSALKRFPEAPVIEKPYDATALLDAVHRALRAAIGSQPVSSRRLSLRLDVFRRLFQTHFVVDLLDPIERNNMMLPA